MAKRKIWVSDEEFTQRRHQYAGGGKVNAQNQLMQIIQAYCQATGANPKQVVGALQKMKPEQQQAAVQQMAAQLQKTQAPQQQEEIDETEMMAGGGIVSMLSNFLRGMGKGKEGGGEGAGGDMSGNILGASLGYMQSSIAGLADVFAGSSAGAGMTRIVPDSRPTSLNSNRVMAGGGQVGAVPVNVEHGEILDTGTAVTKVQGKTHEKGGENRSVPEGTTVFSERISIDGKTMAQRKVDREKAVKRIAKVFEKNPGDYINQSTLKRTMQVADIQEQQDLQIQEAASAAMMPPQVQPGAQPGGNSQQDAQVAAYGSSGVMKYAGGTPGVGFDYTTYLKENEPITWDFFKYSNPSDPSKPPAVGLPDVIAETKTPTAIPLMPAPVTAATTITPAAVPTVVPAITGGAGIAPMTRPVLNTANPKTSYKNNPESVKELQAFLASKGYKLPKSTKADGSYDGIAGDEVNKAIRDYNKRQGNQLPNRATGVYTGPGSIPGFQPLLPRWSASMAGNTKALINNKSSVSAAKAKFDDYLGVHQDENLEDIEDYNGYAGDPEEAQYPYTKGDKVGMAGMGLGSLGPMAMTLANRFGDKPNINAFKDYGTDAKKSSKAALANLGYLKDNTINDITLAENAGFQRNRNATRSLSTNRALDLTTMMAGNKAKLDARGQYAKEMMAQFGVDAQITANSDKYRMAGEAKRDAADRADRDNFHSQFSTNLADTGKTLQEAGKNMNTNQSNKNFLAMMKDLNKYNLTADFDPMGYYKGIKTAKK